MVLDGQRCGVHVRTLQKVGPNQIRRDEIGYVHNLRRDTIINAHRELVRTNDVVENNRRLRARAASLREEKLRYEAEVHALEATIDRETEQNGGVDADEPYRVRQREIARIRHAAAEERWRIRQEHWNQLQRARAQPVLANDAIDRQVRAQPVANNELARMANDNQNVHRAVVVEKVKETVERVLQIPVPPDYQTETLKTSGEIILECKLTKRSAWQMMAKYCSEENIYEMGPGIYARVLNSVWQYIKASPDAVDLKKILAAEMEDNVGMCAQGNLSRLCNILSGYLDGLVVETKSRNEIMGERLAALMAIDDIDERLFNGIEILREYEIHADQHHAWLAPLTDG
jgi:hypothetical protein